MHRAWVLVLAAVMLAGCRSSQPATNPFMRTTVPPPGTGEGAVVVSEPYYGDAAAQQAVAPPPMMAPPPVMPPRGTRREPPGGSFQYNQSSLDVPESPEDEAVGLASISDEDEPLSLAARMATIVDAQPVNPNTVRDAMRLNRQPDVASTASFMQTESPPALAPVSTASYVEPVPVLQLSKNYRQRDSTIRMVGARDSADQPVDDDTPRSIPAETMLRMTAEVETDNPELAETSAPMRRDSEVRMLALADTRKPEPIEDAFVEEPAAATPPPAPAMPEAQGPAYAYADDYATLRGRLEYSQTSKQWKLRYIPIDGQTDSYGGSVVLADSPGLDTFAAGQFVAVRGSLASQSRIGGSYSPLFRIDAIRLQAR